MTTLDKILKARTTLILDHNFFGHLSMKLEVVELEKIRTMATDGKKLWYSPKFTEELSNSERLFVVSHEVLHCALDHIIRGIGKDQNLWNQACDYVVNALLIDADFTAPKGALIDRAYDGMTADQVYNILLKEREQKKEEQEKEEQEKDKDGDDGQEGNDDGDKGGKEDENGLTKEGNEEGDETTEGDDEDEGPDDDRHGGVEGDETTEGNDDGGNNKEGDTEGDTDEDNGTGGGGSNDGDKDGDDESTGGSSRDGSEDGQQKKAEECSDPGGCGGIITPDEAEDIAELEADWKTAASNAAMMADQQGNLPGGIKAAIDHNIDPGMPWYSLMADFVNRNAKNDYDWSRPNRRYVGNNIYLPSLISDELPEVAIVIDSSDSIYSNLDELAKFAAEVSGVLAAYQTMARVYFCDTQIQSEEEYTTQDLPLKLEPKGGGGTDFRPVFESIEKEGHTPACLIYFTDLHCSRFPTEAPEYPVLWVSRTKGKEVPFGEIIDFTM